LSETGCLSRIFPPVIVAPLGPVPVKVAVFDPDDAGLDAMITQSTLRISVNSGELEL
jgi:hypothetical protein